MKILTPTGFQSFDGVTCNGVREVREYEIDGETIVCTSNHRLKINGEWIEAGRFEGLNARHELVYDPVNVRGGNEYLVGRLVNHNCDEFAHIENDTEFYQSTYPVIMSGKTTKVIITSTPNGMNLFYKIWTEAQDGRSQYKALQIYWNEHPNRDEAWLREQESNMPPKQIAQEIHCVVGDTSVTVRCVISGAVFETTMSELYEKQYERRGVVYKITRSDGLSYIGITLDLKKRVKDHLRTKRFAAGIERVETLFAGPYSECVRLEPFFVGK